MNEINAYIERAFSQIPDSAKKADITREITESIENNANRLIAAGKDREDAINKAIVEFGELREIIDELLGGAECGRKRGWSALGFSIAGALATIILTLFMNLYYGGPIWFIYPMFAVVWWPLSVYFFGSRRRK